MQSTRPPTPEQTSELKANAWLAGANWAHPGIIIEIGDNPYGTEATA